MNLASNSGDQPPQTSRSGDRNQVLVAVCDAVMARLGSLYVISKPIVLVAVAAGLLVSAVLAAFARWR